MAPEPLPEGTPVSPAEPPAGPPADAASTTFTVRYHRGRMLTLAAICLIAWGFALRLDGVPGPFGMLAAVLPGIGILCSYSPFLHPYLTFDTASRTLNGPGGWAWRRAYPRKRRPGIPSEIRGGRIFAADGERERRLPFHRFWAHSDDWAELAALLKDDTRSVPPDWIRIGELEPGLIVSGRLVVATRPVRIGPNKKLFGWSLGIGIALQIAGCASAPFLPDVREYFSLIMYPTMLPIVFGAVGLLVGSEVTFEPGTGKATASARFTGSRTYPQPKYDHLEYSGRLDNLYQVRADGKRQMVVARWAMEPKAWKQFTDQLQDRARC